MSAFNPVVDHWDGENRRIYLKEGLTEYHPVIDIYAEYKLKRAEDETFRRWEPLIRAEGNIKKSLTKATPRYLVLIDGTKVVPYDETGTLYQTGEMITDNPEVDSSLYYLDGLVNSVRIFVAPAEAEIIYVSTGSVLSTEEHNKLMSLTNGLTSSQNTVLNTVNSDVVSIKSNYSDKNDVKSIKILSWLCLDVVLILPPKHTYSKSI